MARESYIKKWIRDFRDISSYEMKEIFRDSGALLIFIVAGLVYPLLYNIVYLNGLLNETPIAVVDHSDSSLSRRFSRSVDATRECRVAYRCTDMEEARTLMQERKAFGIIYFPEDYDERIMKMQTGTLSVYCDMSSFLYYKNAMMAVNHVMLAEMEHIQGERFQAMGYTEQEISQMTSFISYEENNPYNRAFAYNIFLISAILPLIIQQTLFYGMSLLTGTQRERGKSFVQMRERINERWTGRIVLGRGAAYWILYLAISIYIMTIVPAIFGLPQRGDFWEIIILILFFITDCVFFSMTWSTLIDKRETVFILFLFMSPVCLFLTGTSWPSSSFPKVWTWFSYLFPTTFGCRAFVNMSTAGGTLVGSRECIMAMALQTAIYYFLANAAVYIESSVRKRRLRHA